MPLIFLALKSYLGGVCKPLSCRIPQVTAGSTPTSRWPSSPQVTIRDPNVLDHSQEIPPTPVVTYDDVTSPSGAYKDVTFSSGPDDATSSTSL